MTIFYFFTSNSLALAPENHLADAKQESRAMNLFLQVRCLVCQGQVIENSNTEFAFQMRKFIRQKISQGESDDAIKKQLIEEFGSDILVYSSFEKNNFLLWLLPAILALTLLPLFFLKTNSK
ncbi:MAG: cytochrome c-type biogenesis protein CcmH [Rickettsiales bacterium]|nr:cytochrome c-type biogenesis protein CcmH [Rickettsiales bacterium]